MFLVILRIYSSMQYVDTCVCVFLGGMYSNVSTSAALTLL